MSTRIIIGDCRDVLRTVGLVADWLRRDAVLIELNPEHADITKCRVTKDAGLFAEVL